MVKFLKDNRKLLIVTFFATIFVHLIKFVNYYPTWDSVPYGIVKPIDSMICSGRWFSGILAYLTSSPYDLQWIEGVFSAIFISFTVVFFLKIFDIQNVKYQYLCVATFVTLPCLTATFVYQNWSTSYTCALLFSVLAVYLCVQQNYNRIIVIIFSVLLLTLSLGTYQAYYTFALLTFLFYIFTKLLNNSKIADLKLNIINFVISFLSGAVLYWIINKTVLFITKIELTDYQGISSTHFPTSINEIFHAGKNALICFISFFADGLLRNGKNLSVQIFYPIINITVFILLLICVIKYIIMKNVSISGKIVMLVIMVLIVPVGYAFYFVSPGVVYHRLMEFGNYFIYFLLIIFLQHCFIKSQRLKQTLILSLVMISLYNFVNANVAYYQLSISYEKTYFQNIEIASKIDEISDDEIKTVAVIGEFKENDIGGFTEINPDLYANPDITGATTAVFTYSQEHIIRFSNYYLGRSYQPCDEDKIKDIANSAEFKSMRNFPSKSSVKIIDGVVVVKLSEPTD